MTSAADDVALVPGRVQRDDSSLAQRRKRMLEEDDAEVMTPKTLREAYVPRQHVAHVGADLQPAVFDAPTARLVKRASPTTTKRAPAFFSPQDIASSSRAARRMEELLPYATHSSLPLPSAFQQLVTFHKAVEQALLVHMATHGALAAEPCTSSPRRRVVIPHVLTFQRLRMMVERTCRRTFDINDFRRLVWIWSHAPGMPSETTDDTGGMGFLVTRTRSMDVHTRRKTYDWAIGIEMALHRAPTAPLQVQYGSPRNGAASPTPASPPPSPTRRENMSHLAIWNAGIDDRRRELVYRLTQVVAAAHAQWIETHHLSLDDCLDSLVPASHTALTRAMMEPVTPTKRAGHTGLLTPSASRSKDGHAPRIAPSIEDMPPPTSPLGARTLPSTPPPSTHKRVLGSPMRSPMTHRLMRWHPDFALESMPPIPLAQLPPLAAPQPSAHVYPTPAPPAAPVTGLSLEERIRAKEQALRSSTTHSMAQLQERSLLSRLGDVANTIYLLYMPLPSTQSQHGHESRILPLDTVLASLEQSSSLTRAESRSCLGKLETLVPGWLEVCTLHHGAHTP
ncbi:hypothetical protein MARU1_003098 [Malassezia arunalokei]|uniref:DNA replication factor Cdt1 C-terminal domain-containing protein n=1 Tax=Malassezia arunalokei TaxID=1514897 RepID=A0AAJ6CLK2_9BASI|nr:hypothetical protein MARU1_003098 [Malassezia arunalokei]